MTRRSCGCLLVLPLLAFYSTCRCFNFSLLFTRDGSARITYELITGCPQNKRITTTSSVVSVDKGGRISTSTVSGTAAVLVTVHEEFGTNQTALVHVEVSKSSYESRFMMYFGIFRHLIVLTGLPVSQTAWLTAVVSFRSRLCHHYLSPVNHMCVQHQANCIHSLLGWMHYL